MLIVAEPSLLGRADAGTYSENSGNLSKRKRLKASTMLGPENAEKIELFCTQRGIPFVGRILYDRQASAAINSGKSLADIDCPASRALREAVFARTMNLLR